MRRTLRVRTCPRTKAELFVSRKSRVQEGEKGTDPIVPAIVALKTHDSMPYPMYFVNSFI